MPGLFQGLEIGKRAMAANQIYLQTIGHNIANVNTPGYTRQRVSISPSFPEDAAFGQIGSGVTVNDVRNVRDLFLGRQYRESQKEFGQWAYKEKILSQIESLFAEPTDNTISDRLNNFWNAWDDLSKNPTATTRESLIGATQLLLNSFHDLSTQLNSLRSAVDNDMVMMVDDINRKSVEIANLNQQIKMQELDGTRANDLRDIRDQLIDELSVLVDVNTIEQKNGEVRVFIGSLEIVNGSDTLPIGTEVYNEDGQVLHRLVWQGTSVGIKNINGQLKGLMDTRDKVIPQYLTKLDTLAASVVDQVNTVHRSGYGLNGSTGINFFDPRYRTASMIRLNEAIEQSPELIAASSSGAVGDGSNALAIQALRNQRVMLNGTTTINDYYNSIVGSLGVETQQATSFSENFELVVQQVKNARESVQGVSLDEEMANMIKFQHAYDAAARVITTMDQALEVVISRMGIVGR